MISNLYTKQPHRIKATMIYSALEEVGKCVAVALCILGAMQRVKGNLLIAGGLTVYGLNTLFHLLQGKVRQRKVEIITHVLHFTAFLIFALMIGFFSSKPTQHFTIVLAFAMATPLFCSVVRGWHLNESRSLRKALASLPGVRCEKIAIPYVDLPETTSALYMHSEGIPFKTLDNKISIGTYNTALISTWISKKVNAMRDPRERAREMAAYIRTEGRAGNLPDVFCLQECFEPESMKIVGAALAEFYPNVLLDIDPSTEETRVGLNSGLALASRLKIVQAKAGQLLASGTDNWANKDFLIAKLEDGNGGTITVTNAHLVAGDTKREEKLRELAKINRFLPEDRRRTIFAGDLNLLYQDVQDKMEGLTFWHSPLEGTYYDKRENWNHNRTQNAVLHADQIDHIAYGSGFNSPTPLTLASFEPGSHTVPSDHKNVIIELFVAPSDGG